MATQNDGGFRTFQASAAISAFLAVDIQSDGTITPSAYGVLGVGVTQEDIAAGQYGSVKLWSAPGTWALTVSNTAITPGTTYTIGTGGVAIPVAAPTAPAYLEAYGSQVNPSPGILITEFGLIG